MSPVTFSLLIIVKNRETHLRNVLHSIKASTWQPSEIIVVRMNEPAIKLDNSTPSVRQIILQDAGTLPLARARNLAAETAQNDTLVFLDVDCIPAPDCFEVLLTDLDDNTVAMVNPLYLSQAVQAIQFDDLSRDAEPHPTRATVDFGITSHYEQFWSLGFAVNKSVFKRLGGFDEQYVGYGGEDTDFAFTMRREQVQLYLSTATIFHQAHPSYDPPLNWFEDIIANARIFKSKWGTWPMEGWLYRFETRGLITRTADSISVLRLPTPDEIKATLKSA